MKGVGGVSVISALNEENGRAKAAEAAVSEALDDERTERLAREGEGEISVLFQEAPADFIAAFADVAAKNNRQDTDHVMPANSVRAARGFIGEASGFKSIGTKNDAGAKAADIVTAVNLIGDLSVMGTGRLPRFPWPRRRPVFQARDPVCGRGRRFATGLQ
jgi:hypothetical protein